MRKLIILIVLGIFAVSLTGCNYKKAKVADSEESIYSSWATSYEEAAFSSTDERNGGNAASENDSSNYSEKEITEILQFDSNNEDKKEADSAPEASSSSPEQTSSLASNSSSEYELPMIKSGR